MSRRVLIVAIVLGVFGFMPASGESAPISVLTFEGVSAGAFAGYTQDGFDVTPASGTWFGRTTYGAPAPFVFFEGFAYLEPPTAASLEVTAGGDLFTFDSVDLYSSVTKIPWEFTGFLGAVQVFSTSGELGNTFGQFENVINPSAGVEIDRLVITLTQPTNATCPTCDKNPMGPDNIAVRRVPEPSALLLGATFVAVSWRRRRTEPLRPTTRHR